MLPMGFGDDWLRFNGIGENVTWGMYNNDTPTEAQKEQLAEVLRWAVSRGMTATFHWHNDRAVHHLLDVLERVNAETPVADLRWSIAHLNDASPESLKRMKAMGLGWLMQNAFYFRGEAFLGQRGARGCARLAADRQRAEDGHSGRRRHRRAPGDVVSTRSSRCNGCSTARPSAASPCAAPEELPTRHRGAAPLHARQRLVQLRGRTRAARSRSASSPTSRC